MKTTKIPGLIIAILIAMTAMTAGQTQAATKKKSAKKARASKVASSKVKKSQVASGANLQTDISFNDSTLHGRYQTPDEANVRVENEKVLRDLLAVRTNFKDRLKKSSEQN